MQLFEALVSEVTSSYLYWGTSVAGLTEEREPADRTEALHGEVQSAAAGTAQLTVN